MNVSAVEKGTGKSQDITIKNDSNRLSKEDIERMVKEGEQFKEEDEKLKEKLDSMNLFEALLYQTKNTLDNKDFADKLSDEDKETIQTTYEEADTWFTINRDSCNKEEIDEKHKHLQDTLQPIMTKLMPQGEGMPDMSGGMPDMPEETTDPGPTIDEVD